MTDTTSARPATRRVSGSLPRISYLDIPAADSADDAPPLLLLHGVGSSSDTWQRLTPLLDGRRLIAPDYRGHGASETPDPPYDIADFTADALRLLDELGVEHVHVLGFSIGALFAEQLALAAPDRVLSLVLLNSIADRTPEQRARAEARREVIASVPPSETSKASAARWFTPGFIAARPALVRNEVDIVAAVAHAPYASAYAVLVENDPIDVVEAITCPTLIMTGELDEGSTPAMSEALHRRIRGSQLVVVPDVKHYIHIELPEVVADGVNGFLAELDR
ncbi:alpha/beta fold hydrolase [Streptosporangium amethystogenes]|uniref:alpha/beta fold hydrolase n=1 Tax=Streptosporangium amethystogenes TaxID=2002 RepID=UPI00378B397A